jgi:predicted permease
MTLWQDVRHAWRQIAAAPAVAGIAIATLALGIGATTAIFSAVYAVVLQPLPFRDPDRVVFVGEKWQESQPSAVSPGNFHDWRTNTSSFTELAAQGYVSFNISGRETPERVLGAWVTHNYFAVFGISATLGRTFTADEDRPGNERVVILSDRLWKRRFGADPGVLGSVLQMDGAPYTIVGVMPDVFDRLDAIEDLWVPAAFTPAQLASHDGHSYNVVGRLAQGVTLQQAASELELIFNRVKAQLPDDHQVRQGVLVGYAEQVQGDSRQRLLVLFGAVALVMLIACGNVSHLLLARSGIRAHEVALRASLGASRALLIRQFLTEALVLALIGGVFGVMLAYLAVPALLALSPDGIRRLDQTTVNVPVLLFALGATLLNALVAGIVPALRASHTAPRTALNDEGRTVARSHDTLRRLLVVGEVALAIVVLVGAGLFIRSALYLQSVNQGFDGTGVLTSRVSLPAAGYEAPERVQQTFLDLVDRLSEHPNVDLAAVTSSAPMTGGSTNNGLVPEGQTFDPNDFVLGRLGIVTGDYFRTLRIPLVAGRTFTADDRGDTQRVMILSQTAARQLFPGESALGKRVACCEAGPDGAPLLKLVVGVVGDVRTDGPQLDAPADFYLPIRQAPPDAWRWLQRTMTVVARSSNGAPATLTDPLRDAVRRTDPTVPIHDIATLNQRLQTTLAEDRFNTVLMLLLGAIGLVLSAIGIYGVVALFVAQRRREIAIRIALGARSREVALMVLRQGMVPVCVGLLGGLLAAFMVTQTLATYVYGVTTRDPLTVLAVVAVLMGVALLANLLPARAATRVDPAAHLLN